MSEDSEHQCLTVEHVQQYILGILHIGTMSFLAVTFILGGGKACGKDKPGRRRRSRQGNKRQHGEGAVRETRENMEESGPVYSPAHTRRQTRQVPVHDTTIHGI